VRSLRRIPALVTTTLLGAALLAGCTAGTEDTSDATSGAAAGPAVVDGGTGSGGAGPAEDASASGPGSGIARGDGSAQTSADREIVTTGSVTVVADDPAAAAEDVADLAESAGGRVENRRQSRADGDVPPSAELTVRVPADRTTATVEALDQVGTVEDLSVEAVDVTGTARDLDARVEALATSVDRLRDLMGEATTTDDLLTAEQELTSRQAELESLQAQRSALTDQVAMSTLHVSLVQAAPAERLAPGGFLGGLQNGWSALLATLNGLVVALGVLLPWLVVAGAAWLLVRWALRHARRTAGGMPPAAGDPARPDGDRGPQPDDAPSDPGGTPEPARLVGAKRG
jgi:glycine cleavage system regulatory protein